MRSHIKLFRYLIVCGMLIFLCAHSQIANGQVIKNTKIWQGHKYASFTSLEYFKGYLYCAFREANSHYDVNGNDNGSITILKSRSGRTWSKHCVIKEAGYDLRDPKLSITPNNELMLLVQKVKYESGESIVRQSMVGMVPAVKSRQVKLVPINVIPTIKKNWLWDVTWINDEACGFIYTDRFCYVSSPDGFNYTIKETPNITSMPTEAAILKYGEYVYSLLRRNGNAFWGCLSNSGSWRWNEMNQRIDCPVLVATSNGIIAAARTWVASKPSVSLLRISPQDGAAKNIIELSSSSDCGYPGVVYREPYLYVSYYQGDNISSSIYLAKILLKHE